MKTRHSGKSDNARKNGRIHKRKTTNEMEHEQEETIILKKDEPKSERKEIP